MPYKRKNQFRLLSILLTMTAVTSFAQTVPLRPLTVSDTLPGIVLKGFLKDPMKRADLTGFYKGGLLLIDFSATWCSPCVAAWPELDSFKKTFQGKLEVLIVTQEKKAVVEKFFQGHPALRKLDLELITDNETTNPVLFAGFPHRSVPQLVWVNSHGQIIASTDGGKVNKANLDRAIKEQAISLPVKRDDMHFNARRYELSDTLPLYHSILTRYKDGIMGATRYLPAQNPDEVQFLNDIFYSDLDLATLFREAAFPNYAISVFNQERLIWDLPDTLRMKYDYKFYQSRRKDKDIISWLEGHGYCYELKTQTLRPAPVLYRQMINDLNVCFNLNAHVEKRRLACWILKSTGTAGLKTKGGPAQISYAGGNAAVLVNQSMSKLVYFLNKDIASGQIVDETGIDFQVDIDLTGLKVGTTAEEMNPILARYHLRLEKGEREVEVFVIAQRP